MMWKCNNMFRHQTISTRDSRHLSLGAERTSAEMIRGIFGLFLLLNLNNKLQHVQSFGIFQLQ